MTVRLIAQLSFRFLYVEVDDCRLLSLMRQVGYLSQRAGFLYSLSGHASTAVDGEGKGKGLPHLLMNTQVPDRSSAKGCDCGL